MTAPQKQQQQVGHRGWLIRNVGTENIIRCFPSPFAKSKLAQYPSPLIWPRYGDLQGGVALVDAVMNKDVAALRNLMAMEPDYDLGLGEWGKRLFAEAVAETAKSRRILRQRIFPNGRRLTLELVTDGDTGHRQIVAAFYRGRTRITEKVYVSDKVSRPDAPAPLTDENESPDHE